jgi:hypothetical protein
MTILRRSLLLGTSLCSTYFIHGVSVPWAAPEEAAPGGDRDTNAEKGNDASDKRDTERADSGDRSERAGAREGTEASQRRAGDTKADSLADDKLADDDLKSSEFKKDWQDNNLFPIPTMQVEPGWFQFDIFGPANVQTGPINSSDGTRQVLTVFGAAAPLGPEAPGYELEVSSFYITDSRGSITESGLAVGISDPVHNFMEVYLGRMSGGEIAAGVLMGSNQGAASVGVGYGVQFGFREAALSAGGQGTMGPTERAIMMTLSKAGLPAF